MSLTMKNGEEFYFGWRFTEVDSTPKDLTNFYVLIQVRPYASSKKVIASFTHASPEVNFIPNLGAIDLIIPPSQTASYCFKTAVIDCWVRNQLDTDGDRSAPTTITYDTGVSRI